MLDIDFSFNRSFSLSLIVLGRHSNPLILFKLTERGSFDKGSRLCIKYMKSFVGMIKTSKYLELQCLFIVHLCKYKILKREIIAQLSY